MKRNKIAAGALALALGLGAVAPSFAADTKVSAEFTYDYKEAKNKFIEKWNALRAAEKNLETAKANEAVAKKAYEDALAKLAEFEARYGKTPYVYTGYPYQNELDRATQEREAAIQKFEANAHNPGRSLSYYKGLNKEDLGNLSNHIVTGFVTGDTVTLPEQEAQAEALKDIIALNERIVDLTETSKSIEDKRAELQAEVSRRLGDWNEAKNKTQEAKKALADAQGNYKTAKDKLIGEGMSVDVINKAEKAGDITLIFENVKPAKPVEKDEIKPETRAALEKAILDAKIQIKAVETLKKTTPKTIAKVVDKLDKLVKEAEATIKMSEELLGKKAAFNVVSTAYAADEEKSAEEKAKELTEKLNEKTKEIEDTLKENEANQPAEEETKPETKPEEKPADDKKDEEKPAEDKKEDKKEEKTTTTTKVVKKAGNNAKTGIAGVAGVAGVLAAASVAYAASKKNN